MSRKILFLGALLIILGIGYGIYQFMSGSPAPEQAATLPTPIQLNELPNVTQPRSLATSLPTTKPVSTVIPVAAADKLVILADSATPGRDSKDPYIKQGKSLLSMGKFQEARTAFNQANIQDPVALYYQALMDSYFGQRTDAENNLNAIKAMPNVDDKLLKSVQTIADAYTLFDTYQDGRQEFLDTLLAKQFLVAGEVDLAIGKLQYWQTKVPTYTDINTLLGAAYLTKGNYESAVDILTKALPNDRPEIYYWLGVAHFYNQNWNKAIAAFQLALNKGYRPVYKPHEKMGDAYLSLNNYEQSLLEYKSAYSSLEGSGFIDLYVRPVWILIDKVRRPQEALDLANEAINKIPHSAMAYNLAGWAQLALGQLSDAKASLDQAIQLDPTLSAAYLNLGSYYVAQRDVTNARTAFEKAIDYDKQGSSIANAARARLQGLVGPVVPSATNVSFSNLL